MAQPRVRPENMNDNQTNISEEINLKQIIDFVSKETNVSRKYSEASDIEKLNMFFSKQICIASTSIVLSLKLPKRGAFILRLLKYIKPSSYFSYWNLYNKVFSQCILFVLDRFKEYLEACHKDVHLDKEYFDNLAVMSGITLYNIIDMSDDEREMFKSKLKCSILSHSYGSPKIDKIIKTSGGKLSPNKIANLAKSAILYEFPVSQIYG
ncbi:MAG: hypothetical protein A2073_05675 [Deltaproteobacteria bacterium GWC2_42_11]|nr:MAG: hypothetical protein A2073_05675 [Deltaproteobacteria bacterium GWC2_42_11]